MPPKSKQRDPAEQVRMNRLRRIVEDANAMNQPTTVPTHRELSLLRAAFDRAMDGVPVRSYPELAVQCDNLLWQLEQRAKGDPLATTGFEEIGHRRRSADGYETGSTTESDATPGKRGEAIRKAKAFAQKLLENENWKFAGIPRRRRLQTLAVTMVCFFTAMPFWMCVSGLLLCFPLTFMPMLVYLLYSVFWPLRHPLPLRRWAQGLSMYVHVRDYFPLRLVIPKEVRRQFDPSRNYMFCYHPHGVHSFGAMINFGTDANGIRALLPGIKIHLQTLGANFFIPFWRELVVGIGAGDASASTITRTLSAGPGESVLLVVGGAEESLLASPQTNDLLLGKRKGFVKLALRQGASLVPVFGFGETNVYQNLATNRPSLQRILLKIQKVLGFALPAIGGRGWFNYNWGPLPFRCPIVTVVGAPIALPKIAQPSQEEIEHWHAVYMEALLELYRENKDVYDVYCSTQARVVR